MPAVAAPTGPSSACSVRTWVWVTLNGAVTVTRGAVVSVGPVTAMLPVVSASGSENRGANCGHVGATHERMINGW
jgi:hypothetical protein